MNRSAYPTCLIVDDHEELRRTIRQILNEWPINILEASSGEQAVETCRKEEPDWVVMDIQLPGIDGYGAADKVHQLCPESRILMISQFEGMPEGQRNSQTGITGFLSKDDLLNLPECLHLPGGTNENPYP